MLVFIAVQTDGESSAVGLSDLREARVSGNGQRLARQQEANDHQGDGQESGAFHVFILWCDYFVSSLVATVL